MPAPSTPSGALPSSAPTAAAIVYGIALIALGVVAFGSVVAASVVSIVLLGALVALGGLVEIFSAFRADSGRILRLLSGVLSLVVGGLMLLRPLAGVAAFGFLLAGFFVTSGLFRGVIALLDRPPRWGWDLAYAAIAIFLGVILVGQWPVSSFFVLGTLVAVELVSRGAAIIGISLAFRAAVRQRAGAHA